MPGFPEAAGRKRFLYGIDEFMKSCAAVRSQAVYTLSYYIGDERDAADLVEYLNAPCDGSNPNGGTDWAGRRRDNGHPEPYNVIYFEVGNEEWHGDHRLIRKTDPEAYARRYLKYYSAMKAVEPRIQVGVIMHEPAWNTKVLDIVRGKVDFGTLHPYPQPRLKEQERELERMKAEDLFEITLAREILVDEYYIKRVCELMKEKCGKPVPLAITEYNAGFTQEKPVPYRHSLGAALVNAEFLRILMKPENSILMANFWQFCNSYWGMVYSPVDFMTPDPEVLEYVKRPSFYVYQLYASRFGEELLSARVRCPTFTIEGQPPSFDLGEGVPELPAQTPLDILTVNASRKKADGAVCLMVVNKSMEEAIPCSITLEGFSAGPDAVIRVLNGPEIAGTNEDGKRDVGITESSVPCADNRFAFSFPAHSVTSIEVLPAPSIVTGENNVH